MKTSRNHLPKAPHAPSDSASHSVHRGLIAAGFMCLFVSAYLDNLRGALLPSISRELALTLVQGGQFFAAGQCVGIIATMALAFGVQRWADRTVALLGCCLATFCGVLAAVTRDVMTLYALSAFIAVSVNILGVICNQLVAAGATPHTRARLFAGLHMMYGWGAISAASVTRLALGQEASWASPILWLTPVSVALVLFIAIAVARKDGAQHAPSSAPPTPSRIHFKFRHGLILALCAAYVGAEVTVSAWLPSFLVRARDLSEAQAAERLAAFFLVLTLTRGLCFVLARPSQERLLIKLSLSLPLLCFVIGYFEPSGWLFAGAGLVGPFFPLFVARLHRVFPDEARHLVVWILLAMQSLLIVINLSIGHVAAALGLQTAFLLPALCFLIALILLARYLAIEAGHLASTPLENLGTNPS